MSETLTIQDLTAIANRILDTLIGELGKVGVPIDTYNERGEKVVGLSPYQKDLFNLIVTSALEGNREEATLVTRQAGKTEAVTFAILVLSCIQLWLLKKSFSIGIFAPARSQTIVVNRQRIKSRAAQLSTYLNANGIRFRKDGGNFEFYCGVNVCRIRMESADPEANIKGETLHLIIIEQPEDLDQDKLKNDILPMGAAVRGSTIYNGTPTTGIENPYFYDLCTKKAGQPKIKIDWREAGKWRPGYYDYVNAQRERLGEDDPAFRAQYCLEWIPGLAKFTTIEEVTAHQKFYDYQFDLIYKRRALGLDWAKSADDSYGAVLEKCNDPKHPDKHNHTCQHYHLLALHEEHGLDYTVQTPNFVDFAKLWKVTRTCDDATGPGDPLNEQLTINLRGISDVEGLTITTVINDNVCKLFQREWQEGRVWLPTPESFETEPYRKLLSPQEILNQKKYLKKFLNQLIDLDREYKNEKLNLHHPEGENYHDDAAKSAMYGVYASVGLITISPQPAAYGVVDTRTVAQVKNRQDADRELAKGYNRPMDRWGDV